MGRAHRFYNSLFLILIFNLAYGPSRGAEPRPEWNASASCRLPIGNIAEGSFAKVPAITDPAKQLQAGDVLIYPFLQPNLSPDKDERTLAPKVYETMLEGYQHAVMVYEHPKHGKIKLESPKPPVAMRKELGGEVAYLALRPKVPKAYAKKPEDYVNKLNELALMLDSSEYAYDALMEAGILDPKKRKQLLQRIEQCRVPANGIGTLDPQSCAEIVITALDLTGIKAPEGISAGELLDEALAYVKDHLKKGETIQQGATRATDDIIDMFTASLGHEIKMLKSRFASIPDELTERRDALKEIPEFDKKLREPLKKEIADLEMHQKRIPKVLAGLEEENRNFEKARDLLKRGILARLSETNPQPPEANSGWTQALLGPLQDAVTKAAMDHVFAKRILRPSDLIKSAEDGQFEVIGYYPGNAPSTCQPGGSARPNQATTH